MDLRNPASSRRLSSRLGNKSSPVFVSLPVAVEGCVPRLWATRKTLDSLRNSADPVILYVATTALMSVGPASVARDLIDSITDKASLQFSSLPGPTSEIYVGGQTLKAIYPLLPAQAKLGISITAITYADQVFVSVIAERALGPAAELILEYLEDQIEVLWNLLLHRRVPGEARNATTYTHFDASESSAEDIASRLSFVQQEVQRISESSENEDDENLYSLRAEFSELVGELKRRHSLNEIDELDVLRRPRRRALSGTTTKKQMNSTVSTLMSRMDYSTVERGEELTELKEKDNDDAEIKEVVCFLADNAQSMENQDVFYSKIRLPTKMRNKLDAEGIDCNSDMAEGFPNHVYINRSDQDNQEKGNGENCNASLAKPNVSSLEIVLERTKHAKYQSKPGQDEMRGKAHENTNVLKRNALESAWHERGNAPIELSHEPNTDDQTKYLGPISTDLRDLYCSNYLQHKLEMLKREKNRLEREMIVPDYGRDCFDDPEDADIAGGVLI
ncbi:UNVERIFIED_CONTAM: hypothetical protein PYX00_000085 [Menopon gallinae]